VVLLSLNYDLGCPVVLACALRPGRRFLHGLGCHPDRAVAAERAVRELAHRASAATGCAPSAPAGVPLAHVRTPLDHLALFDGGALHELLRGVLHHVAAPARLPAPPGLAGASAAAGPPGDDPGRLRWVLDLLARYGLEAYAVEITPPPLADAGVHVVRALVPGLVPLYFGLDRARLGCARLTGHAAPGRLATLLPHFLA
jgi:ribosomal protein S12 methylthiotransferase accessory factor